MKLKYTLVPCFDTLREQALAEKEPGVTFVGRLASYKYFNMDQVQFCHFDTREVQLLHVFIDVSYAN